MFRLGCGLWQYRPRDSDPGRLERLAANLVAALLWRGAQPGGSTRFGKAPLPQMPGQKKAGPGGPASIACKGFPSDGDDVFGLRPFLSLRDVELDLLTFGQGFEAGTDDGAVVREYIGT